MMWQLGTAKRLIGTTHVLRTKDEVERDKALERPGPCITRPMTLEERLRYGLPPDPVRRAYRCWTEEEIKLMQQRHAEGKTDRQIAQELGRPHYAVNKKRNWLKKQEADAALRKEREDE